MPTAARGGDNPTLEKDWMNLALLAAIRCHKQAQYLRRRPLLHHLRFVQLRQFLLFMTGRKKRAPLCPDPVARPF